METKTAVITGASSGIGKQMARLLNLQGYSLVLVARREERLIELSREFSRESTIIAADLTSIDECHRLYEATKDLNVEILINCAGFGDYGSFTDRPLEKELSMIQLNIVALHVLMKLYLKDMAAKNSGYILNVSSVAGLMPGGPYMATYYATKAYVTSLTSAVAAELKENNSLVYVGALCPGPVDTEFNTVADVAFSLPGITAEYCARYGLEKMFKRETIIIPKLALKTAATASKLFPRHLITKITAQQQKKKRA